MPRTAAQLRRDVREIWLAGVAAVRSQRLVEAALHLEGSTLVIGEEPLDLADIGRIVVVGAGKAGAGMAAAVESVLGPRWLEAKQVCGWVNVPADCAGPLSHIHLHAARPAGVNEPTAAAAAGAEEILRLLAGMGEKGGKGTGAFCAQHPEGRSGKRCLSPFPAGMGPADLCLCLISGGGSALLPAPAAGLTLDDKLAVTRHLSAAGANIEQLNTVRKQLSRIKGGGLARACRAGRLATLIISDVLGDPLDLIASGPTVEDHSTPEEALAVLHKFAAREAGVPQRVFDFLESKRLGTGPIFGAAAQNSGETVDRKLGPVPFASSCRVTNLVIGNIATAVDAAGLEAERRGYSHAMISAPRSEGPAEEVGRHLAAMALHMRDGPGPDCLISGGEPVVKLVDASRRGLGGRNQQLALAALEALAADGAPGIALLAGGTDGEDGPTDAAGAVVDAEVLAAAAQQGLDPADYLARNDAYHFFAALDALVRTGPTHTNVGDLRVIAVDRAIP